MRLNNITHYIDPVILDRGREYVLSGYILKLEMMNELIYRAEVEGSEMYEVFVEFDDEGDIVSYECDCPYDYGPICKHQAAVLLKLRDDMGSIDDNNATQHSQLLQSDNLKNLLETHSKESLIDLILSLSADSDVVAKRVKLHVLEAGGEEELEECRRLIQSYIQMYGDDHGFVSWRNTSRAIEGTYIVAHKAQEATDDKEWVRAVRIHLCLLIEMLDLLQAADDSDGSIGCVIEDSLEHIQEVAMQSNIMSTMDRESLFQLLIQASNDPLLNGWSDWQLILLESALHLATTTDMRLMWEEHLATMVSELKVDSWGDSYLAERIAMLRYHAIRSYEGIEEAAVFLKSHLHFSDFRELLIREYQEHSRYAEVIQLAIDGEKQDQVKGLPGLVRKWKKYRYEAYKLSGQVELQRSIGEELVLDGEFIYYQQIKETYSLMDWSIVYKSILDKLEKDRWPKEIYTRILIEEKETEQLLEYVRKQPSRIEAYYKHLIQQYLPEVKGLFQIHIEAAADRANTRKHYQDVCRIIQMFGQAGGKVEATQMIRLLLNKYPRKPAFLDELMSI